MPDCVSCWRWLAPGRKSKPGALAQDGEYRPGRASSPARPGQGCGVSWLAPTQHNGLFGKVRPVAALKLRLVAAPLRAQPFAPLRVYQTPVMSCALTSFLPCACGMAHLRQATRRAAIGQRARACGTGTGSSGQALARGRWSWPPPTLWGQALARLWPAPGGGPSAPQGGSLHPRRWGAGALASAVLVPA